MEVVPRTREMVATLSTVKELAVPPITKPKLHFSAMNDKSVVPYFNAQLPDVMTVVEEHPVR
jgi:hypothetical protein